MSNYLISRSGYNGLGDGPGMGVMGVEGQVMLWTDGKKYVRRGGSWVLDISSTTSSGSSSTPWYEKLLGGFKDVLVAKVGAGAGNQQQYPVPSETNYLPVIAIGGAAVLAVVLLSRKRK